MDLNFIRKWARLNRGTKLVTLGEWGDMITLRNLVDLNKSIRNRSCNMFGLKIIKVNYRPRILIVESIKS
jgi:hypothetical protein